MKKFIRNSLLGLSLVSSITSVSAMTLTSTKPIYLVDESDDITIRSHRVGRFDLENNALPIEINGQMKKVFLARKYFLTARNAQSFARILFTDIAENYDNRLPKIDSYFYTSTLPKLKSLIEPQFNVITVITEILGTAVREQLPGYDVSIHDTINDMARNAGIDAEMANMYAQNVEAAKWDVLVVSSVIDPKAVAIVFDEDYNSHPYYGSWWEYANGFAYAESELLDDGTLVETYRFHEGQPDDPSAPQTSVSRTYRFPLSDGDESSGSIWQVFWDEERKNTKKVGDTDEDNNGIPDDEETCDSGEITPESEGGGTRISTYDELDSYMNSVLSNFLVSEIYVALQNQLHKGVIGQEEFSQRVNSELFNFSISQSYQFLY